MPAGGQSMLDLFAEEIRKRCALVASNLRDDPGSPLSFMEGCRSGPLWGGAQLAVRSRVSILLQVGQRKPRLKSCLYVSRQT
jgi:hypothetical protein